MIKYFMHGINFSSYSYFHHRVDCGCICTHEASASVVIPECLYAIQINSFGHDIHLPQRVGVCGQGYCLAIENDAGVAFVEEPIS